MARASDRSEELIEAGKEEIEWLTVLLPPVAGGLDRNGMMDATSTSANDVADEWLDDMGNRRRRRLWGGCNVLDLVPFW